MSMTSNQLCRHMNRTFSEQFKKCSDLDSGCGAVGRVVASNTRDLRFESSHRQKLYLQSTVLKRRKYRKRGIILNKILESQSFTTLGPRFRQSKPTIRPPRPINIMANNNCPLLLIFVPCFQFPSSFSFLSSHISLMKHSDDTTPHGGRSLFVQEKKIRYY